MKRRARRDAGDRFPAISALRKGVFVVAEDGGRLGTRAADLSVVAYGEPAPKGSARAFVVRPRGGGPPRAVVTHDHPRTASWGRTIEQEARLALQGRSPIEGAVRVFVRFFVRRPVSLPKRVRVPLRTRGTDIDKLLRSVLDALTRARVYGDDVQVVEVSARKAFAGGVDDPSADGAPRVEIEVYEEPYEGPA